MSAVRFFLTLLILAFVISCTSVYTYSTAISPYNRDTNGDGKSEFLLASQEAIYIYSNSEEVLTRVAIPDPLRNLGNYALSNKFVAFVGDVNADGFGDVLLGLARSDEGCIRASDNVQLADCGKVILYFGSAKGLGTESIQILNPDRNIDGNKSFFGQSVGPAGDLNGDGYADFFVSAPLSDNWKTVREATGGVTRTVSCEDCGKVYIFYGGKSVGEKYDTLFNPNKEYSERGFGFGSSYSGDLNNDGYSDLVLGAFHIPSGGLVFCATKPCTGQAHIYLGGPRGIQRMPRRTLNYPATGEFDTEFGLAMAIGDFNGDGLKDVAVGANESRLSNSPNGKCEVPVNTSTRGGKISSYGCGAVLVYYAKPGWLSFEEQPGAVISEPDQIVGFPGSNDKDKDLAAQGHDFPAAPQHGYFGFTVASGDFTGDGIADLAVGAPGAGELHPSVTGPRNREIDTGNSYSGLVFIFKGSQADPLKKWELAFSPSVTERASGWGYGTTLSFPGDLNADGIVDLVTGASDLGKTVGVFGRANDSQATSFFFKGREHSLGRVVH